MWITKEKLNSLIDSKINKAISEHKQYSHQIRDFNTFPIGLYKSYSGYPMNEVIEKLLCYLNLKVEHIRTSETINLKPITEKKLKGDIKKSVKSKRTKDSK